MEKEVYYKYGIPLLKEQVENEAFCNLCRKLFLAASLSTQHFRQVILLISTSTEIDPEFVALIDKSYEAPKIKQDDALRFLYSWFREVVGNLTLMEIYEFQEYHSIDDAEMLFYVNGIIKNHYNTPAKIKAYLDEIVVGQEDAKRILSVGFYIHLVRIGIIKSAMVDNAELILENFPKPNILLSGTTGSGKTYIITTLCKLFKLPFIKIDCSSLVSSGYVGNNLNTYLRILAKKNGPEKSKNAILYFDEFDKISEHNYSRFEGSVGGVELQQEFLSLLEDKQIHILNEKGSDAGYFLDASNLMLIFSGSFSGIEKIIEKRINNKENAVSIGYTKKAVQPEEVLLKKMNFDDLIKFGIIPELVGRIGFIGVLDKLTKDELVAILKMAKGNVLEQYNNYFKFNSHKLKIEDDVYELIAEEALRRNIGARALQGVIIQLLGDLLFESVSNNTETFIVNRDFFNSKFG